MGILAGLLVFLAFVGGQATYSHGEAVSSTLSYWHQKLPTTPIPSALKELILYEGGVNVRTRGKAGGFEVRTKSSDRATMLYMQAADAAMLADPSMSMFLLEKDLHPGTKMTLHFVKLSTSPLTYFLPRSVANKIPFSSNKLSAATEALKVTARSDVALAMKETLQDCESPAMRGESKYCATSLESMVDYATGRLQTNSVKVLFTDVAKDSVKHDYTITAVPFQSKPGAKSVVCHSQAYAYAVYYCHEIKATKVVQVSLKGDDGISAQKVAVCHANTSAWNPDHMAFKALNVKPGSASVCHFIREDNIVWLPSN